MRYLIYILLFPVIAFSQSINMLSNSGGVRDDNNNCAGSYAGTVYRSIAKGKAGVGVSVVAHQFFYLAGYDMSKYNVVLQISGTGISASGKTVKVYKSNASIPPVINNGYFAFDNTKEFASYTFTDNNSPVNIPLNNLELINDTLKLALVPSEQAGGSCDGASAYWVFASGYDLSGVLNLTAKVGRKKAAVSTGQHTP